MLYDSPTGRQLTVMSLMHLFYILRKNYQYPLSLKCVSVAFVVGVVVFHVVVVLGVVFGRGGCFVVVGLFLAVFSCCCFWDGISGGGGGCLFI